MNDWVISIGTGPNQAPLINTAKRSGYRVLGVDQAPNKSIVDSVLTISTYETEKILNALAKHTTHKNIRAVLARTSGPAVRTAAVIADRLGLLGFGADFAAASLSKSELRNAASRVGIAAIGGQSSSYPPSWVNGADWVIKPNQPLYGKRNVYRVREEGQVRPAFAAAAEESVNALVEFQPYYPGRDLGLVLALTKGERKWHFLFEELVVEREGRFTGRGVAGPAEQIRPKTYRCMLDAAERLATLWGSTGFAFFSFRLTSLSSALLYEVNPGLCGDGLADKLFPALWPETDFFALDLALMLGETPNMPPPPNRWATLMDGELISGIRTRWAAPL
jgi:hypothetical protein